MNTQVPKKFNYLNEADLQNQLVNYLSQWFDVEKELFTKTNNKRGFIDILMWHTSDKEKQYPIGIEVKLPDEKSGSALGKWLLQSQRYSLSEFKTQIPLVIIYPQISGLYFEEGINVSKHNVFEQSIRTKDYTIPQPHQHNWNSCQFYLCKTGELQEYIVNDNLTGLRIICNSKHIWDENNPNVFNYKNYDYLKKLKC